MNAWASVWDRTHRRRGAWIGSTVLALAIGLAITGLQVGAFDEIGTRIDELLGRTPEEAAAPTVGPAPVAAPAPAATAAPVARATATAAPARPAPVSAEKPRPQVIWEARIPGGAQPLAVGRTTLYVASDTGVIYSIDRLTGDQRWRTGVQSSITGADLGPNGLLYVGLANGVFLGLDASDGSIRVSGLLGSELMVAVGPGEMLYGASNDGTVYRLHPDGGPHLWALELDREVKAPPVVGPDGTVYVGTFEPGSINAISPDGELLWSAETASVKVSPAVGSLYVADSDNKLWAFDERDGSLRWRYDGNSDAHAAPAIASDGSVYMLGHDNIFRFSPDGTLLWVVETGPEAQEHGLVLDPDGTAYVLTSDGVVLAVDPQGNSSEIAEDKDTRWLVTGPEGTLYLGGEKGLTALAIVPPAQRVAQPTAPPAVAAVRVIQWVTDESLHKRSGDIGSPFLNRESEMSGRLNEKGGGRVNVDLVLSGELGFESIDIPLLLGAGQIGLATVSLRELSAHLPLAEGLDLGWHIPGHRCGREGRPDLQAGAGQGASGEA